MKRDQTNRSAYITELGRSSVETKGATGERIDTVGRQPAGISNR